MLDFFFESLPCSPLTPWPGWWTSSRDGEWFDQRERKEDCKGGFERWTIETEQREAEWKRQRRHDQRTLLRCSRGEMFTWVLVILLLILVQGCIYDIWSWMWFIILTQGEDYMAIYETIDRKRAEAKEMKNKSASMEELETPTNSVKSFQMSASKYERDHLGWWVSSMIIIWTFPQIFTSYNFCLFSEEGKNKAEPQAPCREKRRHRSKSGTKGIHLQLLAVLKSSRCECF